MADYLGKKWTKAELRSYLSDISSAAGATRFIYSDGKAEGVRGVNVRTGSGLEFNVVPGRSMDIFDCSYKGIPVQFSSATGMTSPAYYEEGGLQWLRSFFGGLLTTCGITYCGAPCIDQGQQLGLHGRISNAAAENVSVDERWIGDEYEISLSGKMREAFVMGENLTLLREITTSLGSSSIRIEDVIENLGFDEQPLMMLYHFNFGFPVLSEKSRLIAPVQSTEMRDAPATERKDIEEFMVFPEPQAGYREKVFFHKLKADGDGKTFVALVNPDVEGKPLGVLLRFNKKQLPEFTEWKMAGKGCYVCGLEPGTVNPIGRAEARKQNRLPVIKAQELYKIQIDFTVLNSAGQIESLEKEAEEL